MNSALSGPISYWAPHASDSAEPRSRYKVLSPRYLQEVSPRVFEYLLRFIAGGLAVSAFAILGDALRPKGFAGLFGAAPSIALVTLLITLSQNGAHFAAVEGRSMIVGAFALAAYSWMVCLLLKKNQMSSWFVRWCQ